MLTHGLCVLLLLHRRVLGVVLMSLPVPPLLPLLLLSPVSALLLLLLSVSPLLLLLVLLLLQALMKAPEPLPVAVQRVQQFMNPNGSTSSRTNTAASAAPRGRQQPPAAAAAGDDGIVISDDDDIVLGNRVVSLKDPNTFLRIQHPARFTDTTGNDLQVFELESFLEVADKTFKWIDPHSMKASCVQNMQVCSWGADGWEVGMWSVTPWLNRLGCMLPSSWVLFAGVRGCLLQATEPEVLRPAATSGVLLVWKWGCGVGCKAQQTAR